MLFAIALLLANLPCSGRAAAPTAAEQGEQAFADGHYQEAADAFARAYQRDPQIAYLYARAQAERLANHCEVAIELYERFLATEPDTTAELEARRNIAKCRSQLELERTPTEPTEPAPSDDSSTLVPAVADSRPSDQSPPRPWYRDPWGGTLTGLGGVALITGVGLYGGALVTAGDAKDAASVDLYGQRIERAMVMGRAGIGVIVTGSALVLAGAIRWGVVSRRSAKTAETRR